MYYMYYIHLIYILSTTCNCFCLLHRIQQRTSISDNWRTSQNLTNDSYGANCRPLWNSSVSQYRHCQVDSSAKACCSLPRFERGWGLEFCFTTMWYRPSTSVNAQNIWFFNINALLKWILFIIISNRVLI